MSQTNPWKQQMLANKGQTNPTVGNNGSPISKFPPNQQQTTPPWMKKKQEQPNSGVASNQPAWMKNNVTAQQGNTQSPTVPPWIKNEQRPQVNQNSPTVNQPNQGNQPAWMKNQGQTGKTNNQLNQPAWMQKNQNFQTNQPPANNGGPAWKANSVFGVDKKKKEQQQRLKKQQQQKQRLQRQAQERILIEKQKQKQNQQRQTLQMQKQDRYSKWRQQNDKALQKQKLRLEQQRNNKNKKNKPNNKSSTKKATKLKQPPSKQSPLYLQYLYYYQQSINASLEYKQKLQNQKQLLKLCKRFSSVMEQKIIQIVKNNQQQKLLIPTKKNKIVNIDQIHTQIYYAFCQCNPVDSNQENTANQSTQQQPSVQFNLSGIQKLHKVFTFYNHLNDILCSMSKKLSSSNITKFRTPFMSMVQYKGIGFLCDSYTQQFLQTQAVMPSEYKQIFNQYIIIQKQLKQKYHYQINKNDLLIKKVYVQQLQQQVYLLCLKNWDIKIGKHYKQNNPSLQQIVTNQYFLTQLNNKKLQLIPNSQFQSFKKIKTQSFVDLCDDVHLAQCVFIVYSSCQAEVQQKQFWELIINQSEEIWNLIRAAGYKGKLNKQRRIIFTLFEAFSGVQIEFQNKKSTKNQKLVIKSCSCKVSNYAFEKIQLNQLLKGFPKYIKQNKYELAEHSLATLKDLQSSEKSITKQQKQGQQQTECQAFRNYLLKKSSLLIAKGKIFQAIKVLKSILASQSNKNNTFQIIQIKIQLLALYIKIKQQNEILRIFKQLIGTLQFFYGQQTLINSNLYQMLGSHYLLTARNSSGDNSTHIEHVVTLYEHAISIVLKYYGDQSESIADVYLSRAVAFLNLSQLQHFYKDIQHAHKIYKSHSKQSDKISECLFYKGRAKIQQGKSQNIKQGVQLIEQSSAIYLKLSHFSQAINGYLIIVKTLDEKIEQNVLKIQNIIQLVIKTLLNYFKNPKYIKRTIRLTLQKFDTELKRLILQMLQKQTDNQQSKDQQAKTDEPQADYSEAILQLEQTLKGFTNFVEMIRWLGWTAFSLGKSQGQNSISKQKFDNIVKLLGTFLKIKSQQHVQKISEDELKKEELNNQKVSQSPSKGSLLQNSMKSDFSEVSPIKKFSQTEKDSMIDFNKEDQV